MNFKDLLHTDHEAILQWLLHAFRWWVDELMGMVPPQWRDRFLRRSSIVAEITEKGIVYRDEDTGEILPAKPRRSIKVLLPSDQVLTRQIDLPILPASDVKRMVALDLDRLTPFRADQVLFDTEVVSRDEEKGRQKLLLGVLPRSVIGKVIEFARTHDIEPAGVAVVSPVSGRAALDFLPALRHAEGGDAARRRAVYWWAAAGVLLAFNVIMLTYRDINATNQLREAVESQQAPVTVAMRLRNQVQKEGARRSALLKQQGQDAPLPMIEAVTNAMPEGTWVERFEWNGRTVHIRGIRNNTPNLLARLESSPLLRNAHSLTTDPHAAMAASGSFDLAAEREGERAR
ncbi:MAG: PilN domain-containing protein [Alphaproteobacteria bacterium]|nr:PilN domain-containing protein [Alphaproteobacteria bacterium]